MILFTYKYQNNIINLSLIIKETTQTLTKLISFKEIHLQAPSSSTISIYLNIILTSVYLEVSLFKFFIFLI